MAGGKGSSSSMYVPIQHPNIRSNDRRLYATYTSTSMSDTLYRPATDVYAEPAFSLEEIKMAEDMITAASDK